MEAIQKAPSPKNVQELRSFLGLLNYYGKFIPNLASLIRPLNSLLRHDCQWKWSDECEAVFKEAKEKLLSSKVLALIFAVKKFHIYLHGREFTLITDHKPLTTILGPRKGIPPLAAARLQCWAILLSAYKYQIEFRSTTAHGNADCLSRLPLTNQSPEGLSSEPTIFKLLVCQLLQPSYRKQLKMIP